ncbi:alpha/beta hydrolase [Actinosynnema sp. NPDC023587]|uniref:alpha/beta fold hydrolase n=1 Tax=Actinosynnema sp. NPDC023587 TaxID=3154695 RepID=UPI0033EB06E5
MVTARLHDGSSLEVSVLGDGPTVLVPLGTAEADEATAEQARAWGADPDLGHTLATALAAAGFRVVAADYEGHLARHPKPRTLTASAVAADLLALADAAGADRFAYYGYSWLALAGLQLATRTDRLTALAMGGFPPLGGPYGPMLAVTRATHRMALAHADRRPDPVVPVPGDWDTVEVALDQDQTGQYVTLYESLQGFDERAALDRVDVPCLVFAGENDNITYGAKWDDAHVAIADAIQRHRAELGERGWTVELVPDTDHMSAMRARTVLPVLTPWLESVLRRR